MFLDTPHLPGGLIESQSAHTATQTLSQRLLADLSGPVGLRPATADSRRRLGVDGQLDPSHDTIADDVGCCARTVRRALAALKPILLDHGLTGLVEPLDALLQAALLLGRRVIRRLTASSARQPLNVLCR